MNKTPKPTKPTKMATPTKKPTLLDAAAVGGVIAEDGFAYQKWDAFTRIPAWLLNPAFEQLLFEGLEDFEARFIAPHAPDSHVLERYQAKSADLQPKEVREVLENFHAFDVAYPLRARLHVLVTPRLPAKLAWVTRDPHRVRRTRPFYAPFSDIVDATTAELRGSFVTEYGSDLGGFVMRAVEVEQQNLPNRSAALQAFAGALHRAFPQLDVGARRAEAAFEALEKLETKKLDLPWTREEIVQVVEGALSTSLPRHTPFPLRFRSDRNGTDETVVEIDGSAFSGSPAYPAPQVWTEQLLPVLRRASLKLSARGTSRVRVSGSYRLSTGFAIGSSFRAASGFELEIETRSGAWATDDHPDGSIPSRWATNGRPALHDGRLIVAIGVVNDPLEEVVKHTGVAKDSVLSLFLSDGIASSQAAQVGVKEVKRAIHGAAGQLSAKSIELFVLGPAAFAVALGHRWNGLPPTQLHEFVPGTKQYVPTAVIEHR